MSWQGKAESRVRFYPPAFDRVSVPTDEVTLRDPHNLVQGHMLPLGRAVHLIAPPSSLMATGVQQVFLAAEIEGS